VSYKFCVWNKTIGRHLFLSKISRSLVQNKNRDDPNASSTPTKPKTEHFYRKKCFTKPDISQNVDFGFSSNFAKNNFNIWTTSSISETRGIWLCFKMVDVLKMAVKNEFLTITQAISNFACFRNGTCCPYIEVNFCII
jgi:hypothetical protein